MAVQCVQCCLEPGGKFQGVEGARRAAALLGHVGPDVFPEVPKHRHLVAGDILGDRHPREFHNPALDGVHEGEVAHGPRKQCALSVARALQEEWRRG